MRLHGLPVRSVRTAATAAVAFFQRRGNDGGALVQVAFNLGNAVGAYCGGLPITYGLPYNYPALVGAGFVVIGVISTATFCKKYQTANAMA